MDDLERQTGRLWERKDLKRAKSVLLAMARMVIHLFFSLLLFVYQKSSQNDHYVWNILPK